LKSLSFIFFLSTYAKCLPFVSIVVTTKNPKGDTAPPSAVDTPASNEPPSQEAGAVVKSPEAPIKKGNPRASKHLKKAAAVSTSLDTHRPVISADDV
jgi:hypothetical protein